MLRLEWLRVRAVWTCVAALLTGLVWEKHVLIPFAFLACRWSEGGRARWLLRCFSLTVAAALPQVAMRVLLGTDRPVVDYTPISAQRPGEILRLHAPFLGPPLFTLLARWARIPVCLRWLWVCVPAMFVIYILRHNFIHELRSFWLFVPVFCGTVSSGFLEERPPEPLSRLCGVPPG